MRFSDVDQEQYWNNTGPADYTYRMWGSSEAIAVEAMSMTSVSVDVSEGLGRPRVLPSVSRAYRGLPQLDKITMIACAPSATEFCFTRSHRVTPAAANHTGGRYGSKCGSAGWSRVE
jgi:hypothetical protein